MLVGIPISQLINQEQGYSCTSFLLLFSLQLASCPTLKRIELKTLELDTLNPVA